MADLGVDSGAPTVNIDKLRCRKEKVIGKLTGGQAMRLLFMLENPRMVDCTGALALKDFPMRMLIPGRGIIGLEQGADRDLVGIW